MIDKPRELAHVADYDDLLNALRARADELSITRHSIDYLSHLPDGYAGKILGLSQIRRLGMMSLGPMCRALAIKLVVIEDPIQAAQNAERVSRRRDNFVRHNGAAP